MCDGKDYGSEGDLTGDLADELSRWITRYLAGECSVDEAAALEQRIATDPGLAEHVHALQEVWAAAELPRKRRDLDQAWRALGTQLGDAPASAPELRVVSGRAPRSRPVAFSSRGTSRWIQPRVARRVAAIAAAVLAIAAPATLLWRVTRPALSPTLSAAGTQFHEYVTRRGQRAEIRLADGTRVILGVASRLRVPAAFGTRTREVTLDGQGYFDVVHDTTRPFRVRTALGVAQDVGTAFVVTTYPETGGMRVVVESGAVALAPVIESGPPRTSGSGTDTPAASRQLTPNIVLTRGDLGRLDSAGTLRVEHGIDVAAAVAWTRGELVFRRAPLREVVPQLERWYGIHIRLASPSLGDVPVSASFADEPPAQTLTFIAAAVNARLGHDASRGGSTYTLYPQ